MQRTLRLTHPRLDFHVDVRLHTREGMWVAIAELAGESDVGVDLAPRGAIRMALDALGEPHASEMSRDAELEGAD